jgi:hypothetical protein
MKGPIYMKKSTKTDLYYCNVISNVYVDIRQPVDKNKENFV